MAVVTWQEVKPYWTALLDEALTCTLKGMDIGGWSATWIDDRLLAPPAHLPKAARQPTRFLPTWQKRRRRLNRC